MSKVLIPLADGLEEIEALTNVDVLRRAGIPVVTAGLGSRIVLGSHEVELKADKLLSEIDPEELSGVVLPGGMPGAANLKESQRLKEVISHIDEQGGLVAAICAAPMVLEAAGVLSGRTATSYPGFEKEMPSCNYSQQRVVVDGNLITGRGPGVALEFALELVNYLLGEEQVAELKEKMLTNF